MQKYLEFHLFCKSSLDVHNRDVLTFGISIGHGHSYAFIFEHDNFKRELRIIQWGTWRWPKNNPPAGIGA